MTLNFMNIFGNDLKIIFPETFLTIAILWLLVFGVTHNTDSNKVLLSKIVSWLSIQTIFFTLLLVYNNPFTSTVFLKNLFISDYLTTFITIVLLLCSLASILISLDYLKDEKMNAFEYTILILLATLGMVLIVASYDFLSMYLAIELQSLTLYILATFQRNSEFSTEAGLKYFILGAFSSGVLLFGCSMVYGFTGTTNFGDLAKLITGITSTSTSFISTSGIIIGLIFIATALFFKLAAAPFHMWAPDVYEGAPTSVTAFFAITPKIAILGVFLRLFFYTFYDLIDQWQPMIIFCAIISMIIASLGALAQVRLKRLLAYSAIGHVGFILIGLSTGTTLGIQSVLLYIVLYIIMVINMFGVVLSLREQSEGNSGSSTMIQYISEFSNLHKTNPLLAITIAVALFSMAGIPPLAGFYSKLYIFLSAIESNMYLVAIIGVLTSVLGSVYYIRIIKIMYFENTENYTYYKPMSLESSLVVSITSFLILFFFLYPNPLFIITHKAALTLCM